MSDPVRAIADAVLYEGYVLWPYRRSALKNAQRWTFGCVLPRAHCEARAAGDDAWTMQTQCLVEGPAHARLRATVRFLHVVRRQAHDLRGHPVDVVEHAGERHLSWDEAVERELRPAPATLTQLGHARERSPFELPAGTAREPLPGGAALVRSWQQLEGLVELRAERRDERLHRVTVRIENRTPWRGGPRAAALRRALCSTHTLLRVEGGAFVSLTDPPASLADEAAACANAGTWPVLVGEPDARDALLSSPIILADHPRVAPESPGDFFDGGEIDQLLVLNVLGLTDGEKDEMRASDPRTRALLERVEALGPDELMALHGRTVREARELRP
ncbi:MAG: hypothetical protein JSS99_06430 [Actinobacteria bacterium]|nr:hypothetical protein [Actinomycetota bacterium]